uniref:Reverse transcriptase domain-containing protein n=1 Tax=Solanum lycopersicum TaxID=4081 RepID=A0A3Q7J5U7_SOLLC
MLVINYKPLNKNLKWIGYTISNKKDLLSILYDANIFSKFDLMSGYWQIQIFKVHTYPTAFDVPFGQYEWNVMPFGLKNATKHQKIGCLPLGLTGITVIYSQAYQVLKPEINWHTQTYAEAKPQHDNKDT